MLNKEVLAIDIGDSYIKVLVGNKQRVKLCGLIKTPEKSVHDDNLIEINSIRDSIKEFLEQNKVSQGYVSFALHGHDIVIRQLEMPLMEEKSLGKLVEWEIAQYLPENGANYYINYEILEKINTKARKVYNLLVVATPKNKVDKFVELSYGLGLKLKSIDISANCLARVLKHSIKASNDKASIGIIDIGFRNSKTIILDEGKLFMEREIPFGVKNAVIEISKSFSIGEDAAYEYLYNKFNFKRIRNDSDIDKRIQYIFENALSSFDRAIQFYTNGKIKKSLDRIYIVGGGSGIPGIDEYIKDFFGCSVHIVGSVDTLIEGIKFPEGFDLKVYANAMGLLLRKE